MGTRVFCILALCTGLSAAILACTGQMEVVPWTAPGGTYGDNDEPTTSISATEPIDSGSGAHKDAAAAADGEPTTTDAAATDATDAAPLTDAADAGVG